VCQFPINSVDIRYISKAAKLKMKRRVRGEGGQCTQRFPDRPYKSHYTIYADQTTSPGDEKVGALQVGHNFCLFHPRSDYLVKENDDEKERRQTLGV
jgi:hypothetical protein